MQTNKRIAWIDIAKAITIFLVVFGHTIRNGDAQKIVYSFHVVTFFMLSGMTCKTDNLSKRIKNDFLRLMVPYFFFGVISILAFTVLGGFVAQELTVNANTSFARNILILLYACPKGGALKFNMPLWFLPCLFATKLLYYLLDKLFKGKQLRVLLSSVVIAGLGLVYTHVVGIGLPLNLNVALKMLFYFTLGRIFFLFFTTEDRKPMRKITALIISVLLLTVTAAIAYFTPLVDYSSDGFSSTPAFLITSFTGSFGVCFLSMSFCCKPIEYVGRHTLTILALHKFPVVLLQTVGPQKVWLSQYNSAAGILTAIAVSLIAMGLCLLADLFISRFCPFLLGDFSIFSKRKTKNKQMV
ncbi:MAG: acyltransferase family protein [Ruminococcus sp.]|nr:acyltransferase family protein [Ruminococcus sp.]